MIYKMKGSIANDNVVTLQCILEKLNHNNPQNIYLIVQ